MIQIITDSAADFTPEELQRMNIACIDTLSCICRDGRIS